MLVQGNFCANNRLNMIFWHNIGKFGAPRHHIRVSYCTRGHIVRNAQFWNLLYFQRPCTNRQTRMHTKMNELIFHAPTIAKNPPPGQPHYYQKNQNFLLLEIQPFICHNKRALADYQCGVSKPLEDLLQHGLEGCEYIE